MTKKNTVIFDLDGTLLDTIEDLTDAVNYVMERYDCPMWEIRDIKHFVGNGIRNLMIKAVPDGEGNPLFEEMFSCFKAFYDGHCQVKTRPYDGIMELLKELHMRGFKMAIVSNKVDSAVQDLNQLFFEEYVTVAIGDREGIKRKPEPDAVLEVLNILGVSKEDAVYVGDSEVDAKTARNADMDLVLVTWGFREKKDMEIYNPKVFIDHPEELLNCLLFR